MAYALATLWHERNRFLPGILAVAFSALLIALQGGLLLGLFSVTSLPIDHSSADVWVGNPEVLSVDLGRTIPLDWLTRLERQPEVAQAEPFLQAFAYWAKPGGGTELCCILGTRLGDQALGALRELTPELRARLSEPGSAVVDEAELGRLGIKGVGDTAEVSGRRVRVVGLVRGFRSLAGPYVFCSLGTAHTFLRMPSGQATYLLARCQPGTDVSAVVNRLRGYRNMSAFTSGEFSLRSRLHWLTKTKAGIALGCAALLGLLVGAVVTSQTLYAATAASLRELAVLRALGIPRWRMALCVLGQSSWVGLGGVALALPAVLLFSQAAESLGAKVQLPLWLLASAAVVTLLMALLSGLSALRCLRLAEPATLLR
jgi:putative ABC transport system permease protein